ncbi:deoxyribose phosphate aldolase [Trichuris trichiura]|uniref:Deoxyribose phosphate aldolase n=1 Tax=Trichuris trichiura TaxID=36087 RepID=A0A077ZAB3_TRITR|nr:deoxyribose phosphate aldolase [Trichuris trichiura]
MSERKSESEKKRKKQQDHVVILPPQVTPIDKSLNLDGKPNKPLKPAIEYAKWPGRTKFIPKEKSQSPNDSQQKDRETPRQVEEDIDKVDPPLWLELTASKHAKKILKRLSPVSIDDKIAEILRIVKMAEVMCIDNTRYVERIFDAIDLTASPYKSITSQKLKERPHCAAVYIHPVFLEFAVQKKIAKYPAKGGFHFRVNTTLTISVRKRMFDYLHIAAEDGAAEIDVIPLEFRHLDYDNVKSHQFVRLPATKISLYKNLKDLYAACSAVKQFSKNYYRIPGVKMGLEIRTLDEGLAYMAMADEVLGRKWTVKDFFRIGTTYFLKDSAGALLNLIKMKH